MQIKKYQAQNMPEAMKLIRQDLGPDAVILHTQEKPAPGLLKFLRSSTLEVIAAIDPDLKDFPKPTPAASRAIEQMQQELKSLKANLAQQPTSTMAAAAPQQPQFGGTSPLDQFYNHLLSQDVTRALAQRIVQTMASELNQWAVQDLNMLREQLPWHLSRWLPPTVSIEPLPDQTLVTFVVGPTGVGKTTTVVKLAERFTRELGLNVLIITADTFRVAAIPQINRYSSLLGLPVEVAYTPEQLKQLIEQHQDYELILVDTPGRSQHATHQLQELRAYVDAVPEREVYLALNASTRYTDMTHTVNAFSDMQPKGIIFTKVDETNSLGTAYALTCETSLPPSYLTLGQQISNGLKPATPQAFVNAMGLNQLTAPSTQPASPPSILRSSNGTSSPFLNGTFQQFK